VHLALPAKSVFTQETDKPSASVMLSLGGSASLSSDQVQAITNLVASSVPQLKASDVTVVDSSGTLLTSGTGGTGATATSQTQIAARTETQLAASAQTMLDKVLGPGNTSVRVHADLDFDQRETTTQAYQYTPGTPPLTSAAGTETYSGSGSVPGGVVGNGTTTSTVGATGSTGAQNQYNKSNTTVTNAVGSTVEKRTGAAGSIKRLTVAVLINAKAGAGGLNASTVSQLVANAVGLNATRGDTIQVTPLPFDTTAATAEQSALDAAASAEGKSAMFDLVRKVGIALLVLAVLILAFLSMRRQRRTMLDADELAAIGYAQAPLALGRGDDLLAIEGSVVGATNDRSRAIEKAQVDISQLVASQPDEVAQLLRGWISSGR
jgi:flagellar M-ring protein FliF